MPALRDSQISYQYPTSYHFTCRYEVGMSSVWPDDDDTGDLQERVHQPEMRQGDPMHAV